MSKKSANERPKPLEAEVKMYVRGQRIEPGIIPVDPPQKDFYVAPSREGKLHLSAWLDPEFKSGLRAIQMFHPGKSLQELYAEALNDLFVKYGVPTVDAMSHRIKQGEMIDLAKGQGGDKN